MKFFFGFNNYFYYTELYLVNISHAVRYSTTTSAHRWQRDCANVLELTYVSQDKEIEFISPVLSIFLLQNTHVCNRNSSTHLQKDLPLLVDHWFEWKHHINSTERIPDQTTLLDVTVKNRVPEKNYLGEILTLIGDTPNRKMIMTKLSHYEDFCTERLCLNFYL